MRSSRLLAALAVMAVMLAGSAVLASSVEESEAVPTYGVTVMYNPHATITFAGSTVHSPNTAVELNYLEDFTIRATIQTGYTFSSLYYNNITEGEDAYLTTGNSSLTVVNNVMTFSTKCYGEEEYTLILSSPSPTYYTVSFAANPSSYGSVSSNSVSVTYGTTWTISGNTVYIGGNTITATPRADTAQTDYSFVNWSKASTGTVTSNTTFTAYFTATTINYTVSIQVNDSRYGSVDRSSVSVPYGSSISSSGSVLTIGSETVTATATASSTYYNYNFTGYVNDSGTITANRTVTANFVQVPKDFPVAVNYSPYADIYVDNRLNPVPSAGYAEPYQFGTMVTLIADIQEGYTFDHWYGYNNTEGEGWEVNASNPDVTVSNNTVTYNTYVYGEEEYTLYVSGGTQTTYTVTFAASPSAYGNVSTSTLTVPYGAIWSVASGSNTIYVNGQAVVAIPAQSDLDWTYRFVSWSRFGSGTVTEDTTITAYFDRIPSVLADGVYWCNDNYNGRVDILFKFESQANKVHNLTMDLYSPTVLDNNRTVWSASGYTLDINLNYPNTSVTATLKYNGSQVKTVSKNLGTWPTYVLSMDSDNGVLSVTPVKIFNSFTDYTLYDKQIKTILDFSDSSTGKAIYTIVHTDAGVGSPVKFSVVKTLSFLNTYGVVLYNPSINLSDYFPQYDSIRVNLYSFALYGESMTINGTTYTLNGSKVTVTYVSDGEHNYLPSVMPNDTPKTKTMDLSNIYITFDGETNHVSLTFDNDRFTIDLGEYSDNLRTFSFTGIWYFTTMVYEPYTATEKTVGSWKPLPTLSTVQMLFIFLGLLAVGAAFAAIRIRRSGLGYVDLIIIIVSGFVAYLLLEGF